MRPQTAAWRSWCRLDNHVGPFVGRCRPSPQEHGQRIIFFDDCRPFRMPSGEIGAPDDVGLDPAMRRSEIAATRPGWSPPLHRGCPDMRWHLRPVRQATADAAQGDNLDPLAIRAIAIEPVVLAMECFGEWPEHCRAEAMPRQRYGQGVVLPDIAHIC